MSTDTLTAEDLDLLRRPLFGFLTVAGGPSTPDNQPPQPRPVWYEVTDEGTIQLFTTPDGVKVRRLRRDPRASILVATPTGERERWVSVAGPATIETDGVDDLVKRLFDRYRDGLDDQAARAAELDTFVGQGWVRIVIHPDTVRRYVY
jgi:PPOX class probable F420-dependent enzyme